MLSLNNSSLAALSNDPFAPAWFVVPVGVFTLIVLVGHLLSLRGVQMPASRRRIRLATGFLMVLSAPLLIYGLAYVPPSRGRIFILCWMAIAALVLVVLALAWIDVMNNLRLARLERAALLRDRAILLRNQPFLQLAARPVEREPSGAAS